MCIRDSHTFVPEMPTASKEIEPSSGNSLLILVGAVIAAAIIIPLVIKRVRKTSDENKILKEDL